MELYTLNNPRRMRYHRYPRRRRRAYHRRRNPSGFAADFWRLLKQGFWTTVGVAGSVGVGRILPPDIKANKYLSPLMKGVEAVALISVRDSMPGGAVVADQIAVGAATAGVIEAAVTFGGTNLPGIQYVPTLPQGGGGGLFGNGVPRVTRPQLPANAGSGRPGLYRVAALAPDFVL